MEWLTHWWHHEVVTQHKGPLLLSLVAFVVTFLITRTITRLIRAGKGPLHDIDDGGVHLHHSTPGVILLVTGGFISVGATGGSALTYVGAVLVGVGASLVLDEFAMIFHLQDDYWSQEGQLSVNVVTLAAACVGLEVVGVSPAKVPGLSDVASSVRWGVTGVLIVDLALGSVTALKGKYATALLGIFIAPLGWFGALRLARPGSPWARWFYSAARQRRSAARAAAFDARWRPIRRRWDDFIGGTPTSAPSPPDPVANPQVGD